VHTVLIETVTAIPQKTSPARMPANAIHHRHLGINATFKRTNDLVADTILWSEFRLNVTGYNGTG